MHQRGMSDDDKRFHVALENMRYCRCTRDNEALLASRIWRDSGIDDRLYQPRFQEVSVITAWNSHRDAINEVRVRVFAQRHGKRLYKFYSVDEWGRNKDSASVRQAQRQYDSIVDPPRQSNVISPKPQHTLWSLAPSLTDHHAGVLELCEGMPVMLKYNEATELCATNGAEAVVDGWDSHTIAPGINMLDTLYVRLINPPWTVQLNGLAENVIPLTRTRKSVQCTLPVEDLVVSVQREQVMVLPNFAMTDFASQGHTRPDNVVHLAYCCNHQSIYTCLSRSSSLDGTLIIGDFDFSKLRGGAATALRCEFRKLEILDDITRQAQMGCLPSTIQGDSRSALIASYQAFNGICHVPSVVHPALNWSSGSDAELQPDFTTSDTLAASMSGVPSEAGSRASYTPSKKRAREEAWTPGRPPIMRRNPLAVRDTGAYDIDSLVALVGTTRVSVLWDSEDWSCAYDSLITILWNIRIDRGLEWLRGAVPGNQLFSELCRHMDAPLLDVSALELIRNYIRDILSHIDLRRFPRHGRIGTSVSDIITFLFMSDADEFRFTVAESQCATCGSTSVFDSGPGSTPYWILLPSAATPSPFSDTQTLFDSVLSGVIGGTIPCQLCSSPCYVSTSCMSAPRIIILENCISSNTSTVVPSATLRMRVSGETHCWTLSGCIYYGDNHFTSCYIDSSLQVWYHDGASSGRNCSSGGSLTERSTSVSVSRGRSASHYIYTLPAIP
ncbi:hypothetical protein C8Q79DRAFT_916292 [Trametes meyenii]|nr:hypothetical protein C8Q79DRAFT_916292 [Trametes meyenii]